MAAIKVLQHDEVEREAILEIAPFLNEATHFAQVSLRVFCHPISFPLNRTPISLLGFLVTNIVSENAIQLPQKTNCGYFSYHLYARVLDAQERCVQLGDVEIILDSPIPKDIPEKSYISFDVVRLDWQC